MSYNRWTQLLSTANAAYRYSVIAFGADTHSAWRSGITPGDYALSCALCPRRRG